MNNKTTQLYLDIKTQYLDSYDTFARTHLNTKCNALGHALGDEWRTFIASIIEDLGKLNKEDHKALILFSREHIHIHYIVTELFNDEYNQSQNLHELLICEYAHKV